MVKDLAKDLDTIAELLNMIERNSHFDIEGKAASAYCKAMDLIEKLRKLTNQQ